MVDFTSPSTPTDTLAFCRSRPNFWHNELITPNVLTSSKRYCVIEVLSKKFYVSIYVIIVKHADINMTDFK